MKVTVRSLDNKKVKDVDLPVEVFDYPYKEHLIHLAVKAHLAAQRAGTHATKSRGDVKGSGRKPWRQKGTGRARSGRASSPIWRKGGTVHGPQPRSYEMKLTPREKRNALKSALAQKLKEEAIIVIDSLALQSHRTADLAKALSGLGAGGKTLLVDGRGNENLLLASRNHPALKTVDALAVSVYDVVDRPHVVMSEDALSRICEVLSK